MGWKINRKKKRILMLLIFIVYFHGQQGLYNISFQGERNGPLEKTANLFPLCISCPIKRHESPNSEAREKRKHLVMIKFSVHVHFEIFKQVALEITVRWKDFDPRVH